MMERNPDVSPKWINPCGISSNEEDDVVDDGGMHTLTDAELIDQIVVQAKNAFSEARGFRDEYVQKTFNMDFEGHHKSWQDNHYKWLPELPKNLGEELPSDFLDTLTFDNTLVDTFEHLQRFAVGLEQVLWDLEDEAHETKAPVKFLEDFRNAWFKLRAVLCELQVAMIERGVAQKPDVTRDIMAQEYREMNGDITFRNIRDWLIFRDYMNTLEYVVQVFEHFKRICNGSQCPRSF